MKKNNLNKLYDELILEKIKWQESDISNYQYRISNHWGTGMGNALNSIVIVKGGNYFDEINLEEYQKNIPVIREYRRQYMTIDSIYKYLEEEFINYKNENIDFINGHCKNIIIEFDKDNHIPVAIIWEFWQNPFINISGTFIPPYAAIYIENFLIE